MDSEKQLLVFAAADQTGLLLTEWGESDNHRRAKYYTLSAAGRHQLQSNTDKWSRMAKLVSAILRTTTVPGENIGRSRSSPA